MQFLFVFILVAAVDATKQIDKLTDDAMLVLDNSHIGNTIRQCSCTEDKICVESMQKQAEQCSDKCWNTFSEITTRPQELHKCAASKMMALSSFIHCMSSRLQSCVETDQGPQIPQVDLRKMFSIGEERLSASSIEVLNTEPFSKIRPVGESAMKFGSCVKRCFVEEKNSDGFCYDTKRCQPLITKQNLRRALRSCLVTINWKKNIGDLCECADHVGLRFDLKDVCSLLKVVNG